MGVLIATVKPEVEELPIITTLDLSDLLSGEERAAAIVERDRQIADEVQCQFQDADIHWLADSLCMFSVPDEPAWIREAAEFPYL